MTGIKIPVSADFDGADIEKTIAKLNEQMNRLAQTVAAANKIKFTPVAKGSLDELKQVEARFTELTKISGALNSRIKATGQGGVGFGSLDWGRLYDDPATRQRKMMQAFQHVTAGTAYGLKFMPSTPGGQPPAPPSPPPPAPPSNPSPGGPGLGSTLGGIASAGLRATGPVGGVVANAGAAGMAGGFSAGLMGLFGGLAALGIGKGISAIKDKADAAGQEGIGYDTLKRTLGDVNVSFNALRASLRSASNDIDVTFEQAQKLGTDFARISGSSKDLDPKKLAEEISVGGGFGRSFGMDPDQSNAFFAQMRQFQITSNVNDSKRLALMIGEAVGRTGQYGKMDEVLQAISGFAATQTRNGLAGANVTGFAGQMAGFMASRVPGLDAQGAASLLGRVNGAIMGGGGAGEAGQNYLFSALGRKYGLDPVQAALLQQQGAFGTGRMAFGSGSLYSQFAKRFGARVPGAAAGSDETNLSTILSKVQRDYHGNPSLMLNATARLLGINENQAMALHTIGPQSLGGMTGRMGRLGLDLGQLSATGISALSNIETAKDRGALVAQANAIRNGRKPLSDDERHRLDSALAGGDTEKLKDILTELTYSREQEQTEGSKTRESIMGVEKRIQELATHLVGPMNDMRNALVYMAGGQGKMGARGINEAVHAAEQRDIKEQGSAKEEAIRQRYGVNIAAVRGRAETLEGKINARAMRASQTVMTDEEKDKYNAETKALEAELATVRKNTPGMLKKLEQERDAELARVRGETASQLGELDKSYAPPADPSKVPLVDRDKLLRDLAQTDKEVGLSPGTSAAQVAKESSFNPNAVSKRGAMGLVQVMPKTLRAIEKRVGRKLDPFNQDDAVIIHREVMRENKQRFGSDAAAIAAYNGGWNPRSWGNPETSDYVATIMRNRGVFATDMPAGAKANNPDKQLSITLDGTFQLGGSLVGSNGKPIADPLAIKKRVMLPVAAGG